MTRIIDPEIREEAREWFVRGQHTDTAEFRADLARWLAASNDHRLAYSRTAAAHAEAEILKSSSHYGLGRDRDLQSRSAPGDDRGIGEVVPFPSKVARGGRPAWPVRSLIVAAAAAAIILVFGFARNPIGLLTSGGAVSGDAQAAMLTRHGQIRTYQLSDGSMVTLDTDSEVHATLTATARRLKILRGRARVTIASDSRPFSLDARDGALEARHATLDISLQPRRGVLIHVLKGSAQVHGAGSAPTRGSPNMIGAGQQFAYRSGPYMPATNVAVRPMADESNWPEGWVETRSMPVSALLGDANRYAPVPIMIADPATNRVVVTGRFKVADTDAFVRRIAELLGLVVERRADGIYLTQK